jgi:hypothetical protein
MDEVDPCRVAGDPCLKRSREVEIDPVLMVDNQPVLVGLGVDGLSNAIE